MEHTELELARQRRTLDRLHGWATSYGPGGLWRILGIRASSSSMPDGAPE